MSGVAAGINTNISKNSGDFVELNGVDLDGHKYFIIKKVKLFKSSHIPKIYIKMSKRLKKRI